MGEDEKTALAGKMEVEEEEDDKLLEIAQLNSELQKMKMLAKEQEEENKKLKVELQKKERELLEKDVEPPTKRARRWREEDAEDGRTDNSTKAQKQMQMHFADDISTRDWQRLSRRIVRNRNLNGRRRTSIHLSVQNSCWRSR